MTITDVQPARRNRRRLNIYVDGEFSFACFAEIASQFGLRRGVELGAEDMAMARAADERIQAREYALNLAAHGPRTEKQFRDKLRARGYSEDIQREALELLQDYGYLDDAAYAEQYAAELSAKFGTWTIRAKLAERGIAAGIIDQVVGQNSSAEALEKQLDRLLSRPRHEDPRRERDRIVRALAARGFSFDEIKAALARRAETDGRDDV